MVWRFKCLVWRPGNLEFRILFPLDSVASSLEMGKEDSQRLKAMVNACQTQFLGSRSHLWVSAMRGLHQITTERLTDICDVLSR